MKTNKRPHMKISTSMLPISSDGKRIPEELENINFLIHGNLEYGFDFKEGEKRPFKKTNFRVRKDEGGINSVYLRFFNFYIHYINNSWLSMNSPILDIKLHFHVYFNEDTNRVSFNLNLGKVGIDIGFSSSEGGPEVQTNEGDLYYKFL